MYSHIDLYYRRNLPSKNRLVAVTIFFLIYHLNWKVYNTRKNLFCLLHWLCVEISLRYFRNQSTRYRSNSFLFNLRALIIPAKRQQLFSIKHIVYFHGAYSETTRRRNSGHRKSRRVSANFGKFRAISVSFGNPERLLYVEFEVFEICGIASVLLLEYRLSPRE